MLISGRGWLPQEPVTLIIGNASGTRPVVEVNVTAGADGSFTDGSFMVQDFDRDQMLTVSARGKSGAQTMIAFKDGIAPGALTCSSLRQFDDSHYALPQWQKVTCTIQGATDLSAGQQSGLEPVEVLVRSETLGNQPATVLSVSGSAITFEYLAPGNGCGTATVSYGPIKACDAGTGRCATFTTEGNDASNSALSNTPLAAGFAYLNAAGAVSCDAPKLKVAKLPQNGSFTQGSQAGYRVVVTNPSALQWANGVKLMDELPSNGGLVWEKVSTSQGSCVDPVVNNVVDCDLGNIAPEKSVTVTLTSTASTPPAACRPQPNAKAVATAEGGAVAYASGFISCTPPPALKVEATPDNATFTKRTRLNFNVVVTNPPESSGVAKRVHLNSELPPNGGLAWTLPIATSGNCSVYNNYLDCSLGDIAPGGAVTVKVYSTGTPPDSACQYQPMTASATADGGISAEDHASLTCDPEIGLLKVVMTPDSGLFFEGEQTNYSIVVSNPATTGLASNVLLTDQLPGNGGLVWTTATPTQGACSVDQNILNCGLGTIAAGGSVKVAVSSPATTPFAACQVQPNPVALATADGGLAAQDNALLRCAPPQLRVQVNPDRGIFAEGGQIQFNITVSNPASAGSSAAKNVLLTDTLPVNGGLTWTSVTTSQGSCSITGTELSCQLGSIPAAGTVYIVVSSPATTPAQACQAQPNSKAVATADGGIMASDTGWQACSRPSKVTVVRTAGATLADGLVTYTYTVTNNLDVTVNDITVREDNGTPSDASDDIVVGTIPTLAAGASAVLTRTSPPLVTRGNEIITKLGSAGPGKFSVLSLGGDQSHPTAGIYCSNATVSGNVGVASYGKFTNMAPCVEYGDFYRGDKVSYTGPGKLKGEKITDEALMNRLRQDAFDAASYFAGLEATPSVSNQFPSDGSIRGTVSVTGTAGLNVVKLPGLRLNGKLILSGPVGTRFVLNIAGNFDLHAGDIVAADGVDIYDVIYNITDPKASVKTMMPTTAIGILLAPYNDINAMDSSYFYGTVIGGYNHVITLLSGTRVVPPPVPAESVASTPTAYGYPAVIDVPSPD